LPTAARQSNRSMCDIWLCISWPKQITIILAHRPIRLASRCAISGFVSLGKNKSREFSHIDRFDSPVDVRYLVWYLLAKTNHENSRTSTDSTRQSMCDIWLFLLARISQHASSYIDQPSATILLFSTISILDKSQN